MLVNDATYEKHDPSMFAMANTVLILLENGIGQSEKGQKSTSIILAIKLWLNPCYWTKGRVQPVDVDDYGLNSLSTNACRNRTSSSLPYPHRVWGLYTLLANKYLGLYAWRGRGSDQVWSWPPLPPRTEIKGAYSCTSTPLHIFINKQHSLLFCRFNHLFFTIINT